MIKHTPEVSVIVPVYNGAAFVSETVQTILDQTFTNFELVLVDDGSTDSSLEVLKSLEESDSRIKVYTKPNGGIAQARNYGIASSEGPLIAFCDHDDFWHATKLERQVPRFERDGVGLCHAGTQGMLQATGETYYNPSPKPKPEGAVFDELIENNFVSSCSVVVRRSVLQSFGGFDEDRRLMGVDDWLCWLQMALRSELVFEADALCTHVIHANNYSNRYVKMAEAEEACFEKIAVAAEALGVRRDWQRLSAENLDSRARLCVTKGQFQDGANLYRKSHELLPSRSRRFKSALFRSTPNTLLRGLQRLKRLFPLTT